MRQHLASPAGEKNFGRPACSRARGRQTGSIADGEAVERSRAARQTKSSRDTRCSYTPSYDVSLCHRFLVNIWAKSLDPGSQDARHSVLATGSAGAFRRAAQRMAAGFKRFLTRVVSPAVSAALRAAAGALSSLLQAPLGWQCGGGRDPIGRALPMRVRRGWALVLTAPFVINHFDLFVSDKRGGMSADYHRRLCVRAPTLTHRAAPALRRWLLASGAHPDDTHAPLCGGTTGTPGGHSAQERDLMNASSRVRRYRRESPCWSGVASRPIRT